MGGGAVLTPKNFAVNDGREQKKNGAFPDSDCAGYLFL
jgi:hypothetical protein